MQAAFVILPAALFFIVYKVYDFYYATAVLMAVVTVMTVIEWVRTRKTNKLHLTSTVLLLILGSITLLLREPKFLVWKFSVYHWLIAAFLLWTHVAKEKTGLQSFFETLGNMSAGKEEEALDFSTLPRSKFRLANLIAILYFAFVGVINLIIWFKWGEAAWVNFKIFGIMIMNFVFLTGLMVWLFRGEFSDQPKS